MMAEVRVRFAPSPTGPLHIGGIRTALYNYLFARKHRGSFILRIEDTDQTRLVPGAEDYIIRALVWCGLDPDEGPVKGGDYGPYRQSDRRAIYQEHIHKLIEAGNAYYAFDTVEELEAMRARETAAGKHSPKYDQSVRLLMTNSLTLDEEEVQRRLTQGDPYTVRLLVPESGEVSFQDEVRGEVTFKCAELDDKVLLKADGLPTYHLANVVDDHLMKISHVIRGEEWLSSTAHHVLLYRAFAWEDELPVFTHLPLILKPSGKGKLSKRDGQKFGFPVFPLAWREGPIEDHFEGFDTYGFVPAALLNFLAFLGWNPGTEQELFSMSELQEAFQVEQISKSGARFDYDKALWYNRQYISQQSPNEIAYASESFVKKAGFEVDHDYLVAVAALMRERMSTYQDLVNTGRYFFTEVPIQNLKILKKKWKDEIRTPFQQILKTLLQGPSFTAAALKSRLEERINADQLSYGDILPLLRLALAGDTKGPDLFAMMETMGERMIKQRLETCIRRFDDAKSASSASN